MDEGLAAAIRDAALLEGDFLLRSGKRSSYYLDKYRFGTRPDLLRPLGLAIAATTRPDPTVGLVFYDLKHCLRSIEEPAAQPQPASSSTEADAAP